MQRDLISINDLDFEEIQLIFQLADECHRIFIDKKRVDILTGKIMATLFYEPSTRTRLSFESAMLRLGGEVISTESARHFSSAIKGESIEDSIRVIGGYADIIVLRHYERGAASRASDVSSIPIINAGDGPGEHPTQAILDLYTIKKEFGDTNNFKIAMIGDLLYGRTIHSLIRLLKFCKNITVFLVSPEELKLSKEYEFFLKDHGISFHETDTLDDIISIADILYITRIQQERFKSESLYNKIKDYFSINTEIIQKAKENAVIMHPLPRVNEIDKEVDFDKRAAYFRQAQNGLYIRMAILQRILGNPTI